MYKILGADGIQYGPVSREQVGQWIREGRANGETKVLPEGALDWQSIGNLPEFQEYLAQPVVPPPRDLANVNLDITHCLSRSWDLFKNHAGLLIGATALTGVMMTAFDFLISVVIRGPQFNWNDPQFTPELILFTLAKGIPGMFFHPVLISGLYAILLKLTRGQAAGIGDLFLGFRTAPVQIAIASILANVFTAIGLLLCLIPGIYLKVAYALTIPLILDRQLSAWAALELSRKTVTQHWFSVLGLLVLAALVIVAGALACCVGLLAAFPIAMGMLIYAYDDLFPPAAG